MSGIGEEIESHIVSDRTVEVAGNHSLTNSSLACGV